MGSRGQSAKKQLAQLDRASDRYYNLQERADKIDNVGGRFYDQSTGREVPREDVEKLDKDLREARERFEDLRDKVIERENRKNAGKQPEQFETVDENDTLFTASDQGGPKTSAEKAIEKSTPTLDKDLIRRANEASTIFDAGDATQRQYDRDVKEIRSMDLTATEKAQAIRDLHRMTEEQLKAEGQARSPYAAGMGPARFNRRQVSQRADKAAEARQATQNFMNNLRKAQQAKSKQQQAADMKTALSNAIANKQLSFEFGGKTWSRKSLRSKTFTAR